MDILAIDPGPTESAFVILSDTGSILDHGKQQSLDVLWLCGTAPVGAIAIERIASMGMSVGQEVFDTVEWSGRMIQAATHAGQNRIDRLFRREVKICICGTQQAKDPNIRQALIDLYGGSKRVAIGTKKQPGPLFGISYDQWSALAIGVTWMRRQFGDSWAPKGAA